jgi:hypothetical protein
MLNNINDKSWMLIELTGDSRDARRFRNAALRARESRLFVHTTGLFGSYVVTNRKNGQSYITQLRAESGRKLARCECLATVVCRHIACEQLTILPLPS